MYPSETKKVQQMSTQTSTLVYLENSVSCFETLFSRSTNFHLTRLRKKIAFTGIMLSHLENIFSLKIIFQCLQRTYFECVQDVGGDRVVSFCCYYLFLILPDSSVSDTSQSFFEPSDRRVLEAEFDGTIKKLCNEVWQT